jgi:hypothetical protein
MFTLQTSFKPLLLKEGGRGVKSLMEGDCEQLGGKTLKTFVSFVPIVQEFASVLHASPVSPPADYHCTGGVPAEDPSAGGEHLRVRGPQQNSHCGAAGTRSAHAHGDCQ